MDPRQRGRPFHQGHDNGAGPRQDNGELGSSVWLDTLAAMYSPAAAAGSDASWATQSQHQQSMSWKSSGRDDVSTDSTSSDADVGYWSDTLSDSSSSEQSLWMPPHAGGSAVPDPAQHPAPPPELTKIAHSWPGIMAEPTEEPLPDLPPQDSGWMSTSSSDAEWLEPRAASSHAPPAPTHGGVGARDLNAVDFGSARRAGASLQPPTMKQEPSCGEPPAVAAEACTTCPFCVRACAEHHRTGQFWKCFGYDGPPYCNRCASTFRAHCVVRGVTERKCSREVPCPTCAMVLSHFNCSAEQAFAAMSATQETKRSKRATPPPTKKNKPAAGELCGMCGTTSEHPLGTFWKKYGYDGPSYCTTCSHTFRNHIIRQRGQRMKVGGEQPCTRDVPCTLCEKLLGSFKQPDRTSIFKAMDMEKKGLKSLATKRARQLSPTTLARKKNGRSAYNVPSAGAAVVLVMAVVAVVCVTVSRTGMTWSTAAGEGKEGSADAPQQDVESGCTTVEDSHYYGVVRSFPSRMLETDTPGKYHIARVDVDRHTKQEALTQCTGALGSVCQYECEDGYSVYEASPPVLGGAWRVGQGGAPYGNWTCAPSPQSTDISFAADFDAQAVCGCPAPAPQRKALPAWLKTNLPTSRKPYSGGVCRRSPSSINMMANHTDCPLPFAPYTGIGSGSAADEAGSPMILHTPGGGTVHLAPGASIPPEMLNGPDGPLHMDDEFHNADGGSGRLEPNPDDDKQCDGADVPEFRQMWAEEFQFATQQSCGGQWATGECYCVPVTVPARDRNSPAPDRNNRNDCPGCGTYGEGSFSLSADIVNSPGTAQFGAGQCQPAHECEETLMELLTSGEAGEASMCRPMQDPSTWTILDLDLNKLSAEAMIWIYAASGDQGFPDIVLRRFASDVAARRAAGGYSEYSADIDLMRKGLVDAIGQALLNGQLRPDGTVRSESLSEQFDHIFPQGGGEGGLDGGLPPQASREDEQLPSDAAAAIDSTKSIGGVGVGSSTGHR